ncbi:MAG TPA: vWA domain-containing protein [Gemmataceae bacterium]|nr:vWA domain-containing protein [Gemmataceae bacterium]
MKRAVTILSIVALALMLGTSAVSTACGPAKPAAVKNIDVVVCLDTSNSMDGLIGSAKMKLWDIVNDLAKIKPTPNLRVALYSYGNDGYDAKIGWVRKEVDLTTDLDAIYQKLTGLTTNGGTEYVARVCRDAIVQQKWSEDKQALKLIFVCGNEPASQDPEVKLKAVAESATGKGIIINPIYCGGVNDSDAQDWKQFAAFSGGRFASIDQNRGTVAIATPMDKELASLSEKISTTYLCYGEMGREKAANQVAQDANAKQLSLAAAATRGTSKGGGLYRNSEWDLVDRCKEDPKFDVRKVADKDLPENMRKMKPDERVAYVKKKAAEREDIKKKIAELSKKREAYVKEQMKKNPSKADKAFDAALRATLREQAQTKGINIPD